MNDGIEVEELILTNKKKKYPYWTLPLNMNLHLKIFSLCGTVYGSLLQPLLQLTTTIPYTY